MGNPRRREAAATWVHLEARATLQVAYEATTTTEVAAEVAGDTLQKYL
jgi:hypothetical protein